MAPVVRIPLAEIVQERRPSDWIQADLDAAIAEQTAQGARRLDEAWAEYVRTLDPMSEGFDPSSFGEHTEEG